jgi:hypothetical protein
LSLSSSSLDRVLWISTSNTESARDNSSRVWIHKTLSKVWLPGFLLVWRFEGEIHCSEQTSKELCFPPSRRGVLFLHEQESCIEVVVAATSKHKFSELNANLFPRSGLFPHRPWTRTSWLIVATFVLKHPDIVLLLWRRLTA